MVDVDSSCLSFFEGLDACIEESLFDTSSSEVNAEGLVNDSVFPVGILDRASAGKFKSTASILPFIPSTIGSDEALVDALSKGLMPLTGFVCIDGTFERCFLEP